MCGPGRKGHDDLTSSPPSSGLSPAVPDESPASPAGNIRRGLRSLKNLISHFTARADDSHAAPVCRPRGATPFQAYPGICQALVRFLAYHRIKPHAPPLVRAPVNSFEFHPPLRAYSPGGALNAFASVPTFRPPPGAHRLLCGLPGYLNLFAPRTFAPQRQFMARCPPSPPVFFQISTDFTPTPGIPTSPPEL